MKIRGFRVELGEIENLLLKHAQVKDAVAIIKEDNTGDKNIIAYIVSETNVLDPGLREYLLKDLPGYMVPSYFIRLEKLPLTPSGKIDRKALPDPGLKVGETFAAPRNEIEKKLAKIWADILGRDLHQPIGIDNNFFRLGGHSLKATSMAAKVHKVFNVKLPVMQIFKTPTIRGLFEYINKAAAEQYRGIESIEKQDYYPLSSAQKRLYFLQQMDNAGTVYNMPSVWQLTGILDKNHLETVFYKLIQRHESLRTSFMIIDEEPVQKIHDRVTFEIEYREPHDEDKEKLSPIIYDFFRVFDLAKAPLLRVGLLKLAEVKHILMIDMHHIISDGTSMDIMIKDFSALYQDKDLPPLHVQYKDYALWQDNRKQEKWLNQQENYWLNEFGGEIPVLELPTDYSRPSIQDFTGASISFEIAYETVGLLKNLILETGVTMYMLLMAVYQVFLAKITNQEDIIVGSPIAGRKHADLEKLIGMFVNTLAMRHFPINGKTFAGFLQEVKEKTLSAFENQDYPFEDLVEKIVINRDTSRNPLFDAMFVLQNMEMMGIELPGLSFKPYDYENKTAKFHLNLTGLEKDGKLLFTLEYSTKLFKKETARRFCGYFTNLLAAVIQDPLTGIAALEIINEEGKRQILEIANGIAEPVDFNETIHGMFEKIIPGNEDKTALVFKDARITYGELNRRSNILAQKLHDIGIGIDCIAGLMVERSFELVTGMLGIMKAGAAYLPIDPALPEDRIDYMLKDSKARILINKSEIRNPKFETNPNDQNANVQKENKKCHEAFVLNFEN
ncbi:MAG: condensation domain-containing protein, partial [Acidobacteria bacterium]|nr:condensation domain-containing protein [Acidobacteriota bacterium]